MDPEHLTPDPPPDVATLESGIRALAAFARALAKMSPRARRAALRWLIDAFKITLDDSQ